MVDTKAQSNQAKAEELVLQYLSKHTKNKSVKPDLQFNPIQMLRSPFEETATYKNLVYKVDSLKVEGKRIDARIAKMKTTAELNQAKKDSYRLSKELTSASDELINFMTGYKGRQMGWFLKARNQAKSKTGKYSTFKKTFYFNQLLTQVDSAR